MFHLGKIIALASLFGFAACKPAATSNVQDAATTSRAKTGMFLPAVSSSSATAKSYASAYSSADKLAAALGVKLTSSKATLLKTNWKGEDILLVDYNDGTIPVPVGSIKAGKEFTWNSIGIRVGSVISTTNVYMRYAKGLKNPQRSVDNMFVIREGVTQTGAKEPFIVPWLRHLQSENGNVMLWRFGNTIFDASTSAPVLKFKEIGSQTWRLCGPYKDNDLKDGSIFWSRDLKTFYSVTPNSSRMVAWQKQDADSLDRVKDAALDRSSLPKAIQQALAVEEARKEPPTVYLGFDLDSVDDNIIRIYPLKNSKSQSDVIGGSKSSGFGLTSAQELSDDEFFYSYVSESEEDSGFSLASGRPSGLPAKYNNVQSLGVHDKVESQYTGVWPFRSQKDVSKPTQYYYVERPDPNAGGATTRKVVYKDSSGAWQEESATRFMTQIEKMDANSDRAKQQQIQSQASQIAEDARKRRELVDADAAAFVDKGFVGHMTDVGVATGKGALGPALANMPGIDKAGEVLVMANAGAAGEAIKTLPGAADMKGNPEAAQTQLINGGVGVLTDAGNAYIPGAGSATSGIIKTGQEIAQGDTDGAIREGLIGAADTSAQVAASYIPLDPVTGAAVGASIEGGKKVIEGGALITSLNSTKQDFNRSNDMYNQALQMSNDRRFAEEAGPKLNDLFYNNNNSGSSTPSTSTQQPVSQPQTVMQPQPASQPQEVMTIQGAE